MTGDNNMLTCNDCHERCNANCCRVFTIPLTNKKKIILKNRGLEEIKYYRLHGAIIKQNQIIIELKNYRIEEDNDTLLLWRDCDWLTKDLLCKHNDIKPFMCYDLNHDTKHKYYVTKGCMYEKQ